MTALNNYLFKISRWEAHGYRVVSVLAKSEHDARDYLQRVYQCQFEHRMQRNFADLMDQNSVFDGSLIEFTYET